MQALAVKYRPSSFEEVCGQRAIVSILQKQIELKTFKNAYLFAGASGCGKTTVARIFATEVNKYQLDTGEWASSDPIEIDGASNNGVENVRNIIVEASERSLEGMYKIYIIDEAQGLSSAAWQAFLKCIEEPPKYTIFIFCTTDPQKIPATILNRVMRFNFSRLDFELIANRLEKICETEGYTNYQETCGYIAKTCNGGLRDAIALLEKAADFSTDLTLSSVLNILGISTYDTMFELIDAIIDGGKEGEAKVITTIETLYTSGVDLKLFVDQFFAFCLEVNKYAIFKDIDMTAIPANFLPTLEKGFIFEGDLKYYAYITKKLFELRNILKFDTNIKPSVEAGLLEIARCQ